MIFSLIFGVLVHADSYQPTNTLLPATAFQILETPYDEEKLNQLKPFELDHVNLSKDNDGALVAEKYSSSTRRLTAVVARKATNGKITSITVSLVVGTLALKNVWSINGQNFTACAAGPKGGCKVTGIAECKPESAEHDSYLVKVCPFLAEVVGPLKEFAEPTPGSKASPSPTPSVHRHIIPKLKL